LVQTKFIDPAKLVQRLVRTRNVAGLRELLLDEEARASAVRLALEGLVEVDSTESWAALSAVVGGRDSQAVERVMEVLADHESSGAVRALGEGLGNPNPFVRSAALRALGRHEGAHILPLLLRGSRDPEPAIARRARHDLIRRVARQPDILGDIRAATAEGIVDILDVPRAMELLSRIYPEPIRKIAARRVGQLGGDEATGKLVSLIATAPGTVRDAGWDALEACREVSADLLQPLLTAGDFRTRARALLLYARWADASAEPLLVGFTDDPSPEVRSAALSALMCVLGSGCVPYLRKAMKDELVEVRLRAVDLLCDLPDSSTDLVAVVAREEGEIKRKAITWLANHGVVTPELVMDYVEFLLQGADVTHLSDREYLDGLGAAARELAQQQLPEGMLPLTALVRSVIKRLRRIAIEGIMMYPPVDRADALHSLQDTYDLDVLNNVALGLHECGDSRAVVPLIRASFECRGRAQNRARLALQGCPQISELDFLIARLKNRWASVRCYCAERLRVLREARSIPALLDASRDEEVEVQLAVFEALGVFAEESQEVVNRMLEAIRFGDISVRQMACEALGAARCKEAVPELIKALHNCFLRPRASDALRRIGDRKGYLAMKRIERRERMFPKKPREVLENEQKRQRALLDAGR